jgi:hypothetical protein
MERKQIQWEEIRDIIKSGLLQIVKTDKNAVVEINGRYGITRSVALALLNLLVKYFSNKGYSLISHPSIQIEKEKEIVIAKYTISILKDNNLIMEFASTGAARLTVTDEKDAHIAIARAETRALKRAIETVIGESINKLILECFQQDSEVKISKYQLTNYDDDFEGNFDEEEISEEDIPF